MAMTSPLHCINNRHDFKVWVENQRITITIKLDFDLDFLLKNGSRTLAHTGKFPSNTLHCKIMGGPPSALVILNPRTCLYTICTSTELYRNSRLNECYASWQQNEILKILLNKATKSGKCRPTRCTPTSELGYLTLSQHAR